MCIIMCMRLHITLEDDLVAELDDLVGPGKRSAFITASIRKALDEARRWDGILDSLGSLPGDGGDWGDDPEAWIDRERRSDPGRVG
jgi:Arc/MetJ-type ribon-helix-helix transcriptional regulator